MKHSNHLLILAGLLSFGAAIFQIAIGIIPEWSAYWGAGDELVSNPPLLLGSSLGVALLAAVAGLYALSGAGLVRRLPLLRTGLLVVGILCTLCGIAFVLLLLTVLRVLPSQGPILTTAWQSSFVFLLIGLTYLFGLAYGWRALSQPAPKVDQLATAR
jgi:putative oxidoreductase